VRRETARCIREYIVENFLFGDASTPIDDDASLLEIGIVDSTGVLDLLAFVEEQFGIEVADEELIPDNFDSVSRLADYIDRKQTAV
jgi:acyl carrier protein